MNSTLSLIGTLTLLTNGTFVLNGVLFFDNSNKGSNVSLRSSSKTKRLTETGKGKSSSIELPDLLSLSGKVLPLGRDSSEGREKMTITLKTFSNSARLELEIVTNLLSKTTLSGSYTKTDIFWDIKAGAELEKPYSSDVFTRKHSWRQGVGKGKRLKISGYQEPIPEPTLWSYQHLRKNRTRITWKFPVHVEGQIVSMQLQIKAANGQGWPLPSKLKKNPSPDLLGRIEVKGELLKLSFPPIALRSDKKQLRDEEYNSFYRTSTHSFVLDMVDIGEYEVTAIVSTLNTDEETDEAFFGAPVRCTFPVFCIYAPPDCPTDLSAIVQKTNTTRSGSDEIICEAFVVASWKPPECSLSFDNLKSRRKKGGPADCFSVGLEVFNVEKSCWQQFGEPTFVQRNFVGSSTEKESCIIEALPEVLDCKKHPLFSKFRVYVRSLSIFGESRPLFSRDIDIPRFEIDAASESIDFCNVEEATCVICYDRIAFESGKDVMKKVIEACRCASKCHATEPCPHPPINGVVTIPEKLFTTPVSPTSCSHLYHMKCLLDWSNSSRQRVSAGSAKCPLCMQPFRHVTSHVLGQDNQNNRQLFCSTAQVKKRPEAGPIVVGRRGKFGKQCQLADFPFATEGIVDHFEF